MPVNNYPSNGFEQQVDAALRELHTGWGMPTEWYHDASVYRLEMDTIFAREWQYFAPTQSLLRPGDCVVGKAGEIPVFVVRDNDGELRGFVNMCRHRGHPVARADGNARVLVCGYHGWTYNLDGSLRGAPDSREEPDFNCSELSLLPISVDCWGHAVFVNPDPDALPFRKAHPRFEETWQSRGLIADLDAYQLRRRVEYPAECNWKLWYDNNVECYHCPTVHGESFSSAYNVKEDEVDHYELDRMTTYKFPPRKGGRQHDGDQLVGSNFRSMQVFPGITIVQQDDLMVIAQMIPEGPEKTVSIMDYFTERGTDESRFERWFQIWDQTFMEDLTVACNQQIGMRTGRLKRSRFMTKRERPVLFINRLILESYQRAASSQRGG